MFFRSLFVLCTFSFGHCVVCSTSTYGLRLSLWYLQTLLVLLYFFFWPLCCLFFFDIRILITPLVSSNSSCPFVLFLLAIVLSVFLRYTDSDYPFGIFKLFLSFCTLSFGHCVVCSTSTYDYDCPFGIFKLFLYRNWWLCIIKCHIECISVLLISKEPTMKCGTKKQKIEIKASSFTWIRFKPIPVLTTYTSCSFTVLYV